MSDSPTLTHRYYPQKWFPTLLNGCSNNPSFKIAMSGRAGVGRRPRFTFRLTFLQSYMLPLFFNGLLLYLVGMKRRTSSSERLVQEKQLSLSSLCTYFPWLSMFSFWLTFFESYVTFILQFFAFIFGRNIQRAEVTLPKLSIIWDGGRKIDPTISCSGFYWIVKPFLLP